MKTYLSLMLHLCIRQQQFLLPQNFLLIDIVVIIASHFDTISNGFQ